MADSYQSRRRKVSRARERYEARQRRRTEGGPAVEADSAQLAQVMAAAGRATLPLRDAWWHLSHVPGLMTWAAGGVAALVMIFILSYLLQGRIYPNVWAFGVYLGDMTVEEAAVALQKAWREDVRLVLADGDRRWEVAPLTLGLNLDPLPIAEAAKGVGMAGMPFGWYLDPVVSVNQALAQEYILALTQETDSPPFNAGFRLDADEVVGVRGYDGRRMDAARTIERLNDNVLEIVKNRRLDLVMEALPPDVYDPEPYLDQARALISDPFQMVGYDPFTDDYISWQTTPEVFASWLQVTASGMTLRESSFGPFLEAQNGSLNTSENARYLDTNETMDKVRAAISGETELVSLRIRYRPTQHQVVYGDRAYGIARRSGIPYFLVEEANSGRDLNQLSPGDVINIPSRDLTMPYDPVPHKRIIIDLSRQSLVAYENGQEKFRWLISSGMSQAPTSPGIFQILSHDELALGSSYTLCGAQGCGQWQMYWFMGIYEVTPGLMNGFHGAVLLPNGAYLGGGNVGQPYTFGCIMSLNENAELLFRWAEIGTVVEIISSEFPPQSDLARRAFSA